MRLPTASNALAPNTDSLVPIDPFWVDFSLKCPKSGMRPTGGPHPEKKPKNLLMDMDYP